MEKIQELPSLIEARPYLQQFRGSILVVKYGGSAMDDPALMDSTLHDLAVVEAVGIELVVVHGGGKSITRKMKEAGIQATFVSGLRVTDTESMAIVESVLDQETNPAIVSGLTALGCPAVGMSGKQVLRVEKSKPLKLDSGEEADLGLVGEVLFADANMIRDLLEQHKVPVISPVGCDKNGIAYNTNADLAAMQIAIQLQASKLIYISDVPGVLRDRNDARTVIPTISRPDVERLKEEGILSGGMLPKVESALDALRRGVGKVQFIDGRFRHSLLIELFTAAGCGTEIVD